MATVDRKMTREQAEPLYRAERDKAIAAGMTKEEFDRIAKSFAHETADGEEMKPAYFVEAARYINTPHFQKARARGFKW